MVDSWPNCLVIPFGFEAKLSPNFRPEFRKIEGLTQKSKNLFIWRTFSAFDWAITLGNRFSQSSNQFVKPKSKSESSLTMGNFFRSWISKIWGPNSKIEEIGHLQDFFLFRMVYNTSLYLQPILQSIRGHKSVYTLTRYNLMAIHKYCAAAQYDLSRPTLLTFADRMIIPGAYQLRQGGFPRFSLHFWVFGFCAISPSILNQFWRSYRQSIDLVETHRLIPNSL
jgi:hypothetical protein